MDQDVTALFREVADLPPAERAAYYASRQIPAGLREEVESLLRFDGVQTHSIQSFVAAGAGQVLLEEAAMREGSRCGGYRLLRLIGHGGMGAVYEAEQESPRRMVALKVIKPGLATAELVRRFEQESQVLGRLHHIGIAQIYEAGTADMGFGPQPYFAMEFIHGQPLKAYCESHAVDTRGKLDLMARVAEAVHHAHQRGIIHRDLKPGNILVDETGQPKILDFGVARVTDSDAQATRQTDVGQLIGTLAYMSPEQVLADPLELDTRTDIYSLGVILYELLAGRPPYRTEGQLHEVLRAIREADASSLSAISRAYRGDVETIVAKALEKEKSRRYGSAAALAGDIRRYLQDEPITARPPSTAYHLQKFVRRHKGLAGGAAAVLAVLVAGVIVSLSLAARARSEAATAKAVSDFLQNDLLAQASASTQSGPNTKPDPDLKVRTALDRAAARIQGRFAKQPLVEASIRQTIALTYADLGLWAEAQRQVEPSLALRTRALGEEHEDTLFMKDMLAWMNVYQGRYAQAEPLHAGILNIRRRRLGEEHPDTLISMHNLAYLFRAEGKYADAEPLVTKALEIQRRVLGKEHPDTLNTLANLASLYQSQGKYAQAEPLSVQAYELRVRVLGEEHAQTLVSMNTLASLYDRQGKLAQAEPLKLKILEISGRVFGAEHPNTLVAMNNLALLYVREGKYAQAELLAVQALEVTRRVLGDQHPNTPGFRSTLAAVFQAQGRYAQAEPLRVKVVEDLRHLLGAEHPNTLSGLHSLGVLYYMEKKFADAEVHLSGAVEKRRRVLGPQHPDTLSSMAALSECRLEQRKYGEAEALLRETVSAREKASPDAWERYHAQSLLSAALAAQQKYAEAEPLAVSGYEGLTQRASAVPAPDRYRLGEAGRRIVRLYQEWGKREKAAEWQAKVKASAVVSARR